MVINQINANVLAVAYRGFNGNYGSPTEKGLKLDADSIIKYVKS